MQHTADANDDDCIVIYDRCFFVGEISLLVWRSFTDCNWLKLFLSRNGPDQCFGKGWVFYLLYFKRHLLGKEFKPRNTIKTKTLWYTLVYVRKNLFKSWIHSSQSFQSQMKQIKLCIILVVDFSLVIVLFLMSCSNLGFVVISILMFYRWFFSFEICRNLKRLFISLKAYGRKLSAFPEVRYGPESRMFLPLSDKLSDSCLMNGDWQLPTRD